MRFICICFDHFAAAVELKESPELVGCPVVIGGYPHERKRAFDCSAEAARLGVAPGMPLRQAYHLCPDAIFLPLDEERYTSSFDEVLDILEKFSPGVEAAGLGKAFLDGSGMLGLYSSEESLALQISSEVGSRTYLEPKVGIAGSKFVAEIAAAQASPQRPCIVEAGREKEFLEPLPSSLLPVSEEVKTRLDMLGLRTLGQIASLPVEALATQFGEEGVLAHQLANGVDSRPLLPRSKPAVLEAEISCDSPLDSLDGILSAVERLLDRLIPGLRSRNQACAQIRLCLSLDGAGLWNESFNLKGPTDSKQAIVTFLKHRLEAECFPAGITDVRLELAQLGAECAKQPSLLQMEKLKQEEQLKRSARQLKARLGKNPLKKVIPLAPASRIPERRSALTDLNL